MKRFENWNPKWNPLHQLLLNQSLWLTQSEKRLHHRLAKRHISFADVISAVVLCVPPWAPLQRGCSWRFICLEYPSSNSLVSTTAFLTFCKTSRLRSWSAASVKLQAIGNVIADFTEARKNKIEHRVAISIWLQSSFNRPRISVTSRRLRASSLQRFGQ